MTDNDLDVDATISYKIQDVTSKIKFESELHRRYYSIELHSKLSLLSSGAMYTPKKSISNAR